MKTQQQVPSEVETKVGIKVKGEALPVKERERFKVVILLLAISNQMKETQFNLKTKKKTKIHKTYN